MKDELIKDRIVCGISYIEPENHKSFVVEGQANIKSSYCYFIKQNEIHAYL